MVKIPMHCSKKSLIKTLCTSGLALGLLVFHSAAAEENPEAKKYWNNFRGPTENGVSTTAQPPSQWSTTENIAWKTALPGNGSSSPIVWGERVFVTAAINMQSDADEKQPPRMNRQEMAKFDEDGDGQFSDTERAKLDEFVRSERQKSLGIHRFAVICLDRTSGKILWEETATEKKPQDGHHQDHGYASASPVTDGKHVYVSFGSNGIFCFDFDGKKIWERLELGEMRTRGGFGEGSSLALFENSLILPWDHEGQSRIEAIDKMTGETQWKTDRDEPSNWATPRVVTMDGRNLVIQAGENYTRGYDLDTGKEVWRSSGLSSRPVSTPVVLGNVGYFASARISSALNAYYLDRKGDISDQPVWTIKQHTPDCPSLLLSENRLYYLSGNKGILSCANADDGSLLFETQRLRGIDGVYSSPVAAGGKVFLTGRKGKTVVIEDAPNFNVLGQNDIGEGVDATLALAGDQIFIRGAKHLFCVQDK